MAAEWRLANASKERRMVRKVCDRVYEELDDFIEELQVDLDGCRFDGLRIEALYQLRRRLMKVLPFDPEEK